MTQARDDGPVPPDGLGLNSLLDRVPRLRLDVGTRRVPAFRSLGIIGFHVAVVVAIATALRTGVPLVAALGLAAVAGLSFFGWGLLRRAVTGHESLVLIEYVWVAYAAVAGFAWASGLAVAPLLDVYSVAVAPFLAFGRLGCATVGCCHGYPSRVGLRYGPGHALPERLVGRRLLPVQLIEGGALLGIGASGFLLAPLAPGTATVWFLAAYAVVRFGCERLRGDDRPVRVVPLAQSMCVVQAGAAIAASEAWLVPGPPGRATVIGVAVLAVAALAGLALAASRGRNPLVASSHLDEIWNIVSSSPASVASARTPLTTRTSLEMVVAVTACPSGWHVSMSHHTYDTVAVAVALGGTSATNLHGVTHSILQSTAPHAPRQHASGSERPDPPESARSSAARRPDYFAVGTERR